MQGFLIALIPIPHGVPSRVQLVRGAAQPPQLVFVLQHPLLRLLGLLVEALVFGHRLLELVFTVLQLAEQDLRVLAGRAASWAASSAGRTAGTTKLGAEGLLLLRRLLPTKLGAGLLLSAEPAGLLLPAEPAGLLLPAEPAGLLLPAEPAGLLLPAEPAAGRLAEATRRSSEAAGLHAVSL